MADWSKTFFHYGSLPKAQVSLYYGYRENVSHNKHTPGEEFCEPQRVLWKKGIGEPIKTYELTSHLRHSWRTLSSHENFEAVSNG
ncbi:hypothetical protein TNCV_1324631 [Trichonephila clavipes]|nr:hypothetical protein TNCV_1324631 [Trichonephila clavipes]